MHALMDLTSACDTRLRRHLTGVGVLAEAVATWMRLGRAEVVDVRLAAELHDIGKLEIDRAILDKPGPLTPAEWRVMRLHTVIGERLVRARYGDAHVAAMVRASHERFDGRGYPDGLEGREILLGARIVFACDALHAMISDRPYAPGLDDARAIGELRRCAGTQFDPSVVDALCEICALGRLRRADDWC